MIKDSGTRRRFESGAVRDGEEGKGRCDLMPLSVIARYSDSMCLTMLSKYIKSKDNTYLENSIYHVIEDYFPDEETAWLELAKHYEEGAKKYEERNWEKGIPESVYIDSALRHLFKFERGDTDEPHNRALLWNLVCLLWTKEKEEETRLNSKEQQDTVKMNEKSLGELLWEILN